MLQQTELKTARRPPVANPEAALRIYYSKPYITCKDITEIFGSMGSALMARLRRAVREQEAAENVPIVVPRHICTEVAFRVWNIDVKKLESDLQKLRKLNLA